MDDVIAIGVLTGPGDVVLNHGNTLKVGWALNTGWTWSATVYGSDFNIRHARGATYSITLQDGFGNTLECPPMVALPREKNDDGNDTNPGVITLSGVDEATYKMGKQAQSFPSQKATLSTQFVSLIALRAGVTVTGLLEWFIGEHEVKGQLLSEALDNLLEPAAYVHRVSKTGVVECSAWEASGDPLDWPYRNRTHLYDDTRIYSGKRIGKRSSRSKSNEQEYTFNEFGGHQLALTGPMIGFGCYEADLLGAIGGVAFFDGPQDSGGNLLQFFSFHPDYVNTDPATGTPPATHITVSCRDLGFPYPVPALLKVTGTPYVEDGFPEGFDLSFYYPTPTPVGAPTEEDPDPFDGSLGEWPSDNALITPLFPGQTWAVDRYPWMMAIENQEGDQLKYDGLFHLGVEPNQRDTYEGLQYKLVSVEWDCGSKKTDALACRLDPNEEA